MSTNSIDFLAADIGIADETPRNASATRLRSIPLTSAVEHKIET